MTDITVGDTVECSWHGNLYNVVDMTLEADTGDIYLDLEHCHSSKPAVRHIDDVKMT